MVIPHDQRPAASGPQRRSCNDAAFGTQPEITGTADAILRESGSLYTLPGRISALDEVISQFTRATRQAIADVSPPSRHDPASF